MAELNEKQLRAHIKEGQLLPVYLFYGNEPYLKKLHCDSLCEKAVSKEFFDFNLNTFDGKSLDLRDALDTAQLLPLMSERRCVLIYDARLESMSEAEKELLFSYLEKPAESTVLIFFQSASDFSPLKARAVVDQIKSRGAVCVLNKRSGNELIKPLISSASKKGCTLTSRAAEYLVSVVGDDFNVLINELDKVCHYAGGGEIEKHHIDAVAIKCDDAKIYDLGRFILTKSFDKAYDTLSQLLRQRVEPGYILGTVIGTYLDLYRGKISVTSGKNADYLAKAYGYTAKNSFRLKNGARDSARLEAETLRKYLDELAQADMKLKSSREEPSVILEQLIVRLFLVGG